MLLSKLAVFRLQVDCRLKHAFHIILRVLTLLFRNKAQLVILAQDKVQVGFGWNKGAKLKPWKTEAGWEGDLVFKAF